MRTEPNTDASSAPHRPLRSGVERRNALSRDDDERRFELPGFQPFEAYEAAIASLAPEIERREIPESVEEILSWAGEPLATAEVAAVAGLEHVEAQERLARVAGGVPVGADLYWTLRAGAARRRPHSLSPGAVAVRPRPGKLSLRAR